MADEPTQIELPATEPAAVEAAHVATPESDPTPRQAESKSITSEIDKEIDDLWAKAEGRLEPPAESETPAAPVTTETPEKPADPKPESDAPKSEPDREAIEREVRERLDREQKAKDAAEEKIKAEQAFRSQVDAYTGSQTDYEAVNAALRQAVTSGDMTALDALDVVLPNGKRVSEVKGGAKGLTQEEAGNLLSAWEMNRSYEDVMGDRKVARILGYWNDKVDSALADPDVDAAAVKAHEDPPGQMAALRDSVRERVTARLTAEHAEVVKAKDAEIAQQAQRIESLLKERGNLTAQQRASQAATPDRPGEPGTLRRGLPSPDELAQMDAKNPQTFKEIDRILQSIPGGLSRRAG